MLISKLLHNILKFIKFSNSYTPFVDTQQQEQHVSNQLHFKLNIDVNTYGNDQLNYPFFNLLKIVYRIEFFLLSSNKNMFFIILTTSKLLVKFYEILIFNKINN